VQSPVVSATLTKCLNINVRELYKNLTRIYLNEAVMDTLFNDNIEIFTRLYEAWDCAKVAVTREKLIQQ